MRPIDASPERTGAPVDGPFSMLDGHEQVVFGNDPESGLRCIIAIHSTALGPGLGGTRFYPYASEEEALVDVLRLSRGMSYKAACAGLSLGGGKAVIIGDPDTDKTEALLRAYGRMVESLNGRYITACDVGTYPRDLEVVGRETRWATGADHEHGGSGDSGIMTAYGVYLGMRATAQQRWGSPSLSGKHVAVQGLGKVGHRLVEHLLDEGAKVTATDVSEEAVARVAEHDGVDTVAPDGIFDVDADILSPNALGAVLTEDTIPRRLRRRQQPARDGRGLRAARRARHPVRTRLRRERRRPHQRLRRAPPGRVLRGAGAPQGAGHRRHAARDLRRGGGRGHHHRAGRGDGRRAPHGRGRPAAPGVAAPLRGDARRRRAPSLRRRPSAAA
jgi:hypothetical protein